jgi:CRP-like cAMP-binding protein
MLGVALAKARGTEVLGKFLDKADVLYCGLEDGERRMQTRVAKILGPAIKNWPDNFTFRYHLDPLEDGGVDTLEAWLKGHPAGRLIVIDTLAKVRGIKRANEEQYQYDYRIVGLLQELATKYRIAIVVIHHVRKTEAEDVLDTIAGSTGLGGAADCLQVLSRHEKGTRLYLRGRDAEEQDKLVEFDAETALWEVICNFDEQPGGDLSGLRRLVFECLRGHAPVHLTPAEVAEKIGHPRPNVQRTLNRMAHADPPEARRSPLKRGAYELVK